LYKLLLVFHVVKQVIITVLRVIVNLCCRLFHFMMLFLLFSGRRLDLWLFKTCHSSL